MPFRLSGLVALVVIAGVLWGETPSGQGGDRSKTPPVEPSSGGFTIRRLTGPVTVDGRTWIAVDPIFGPRTVTSANGRFTLSLDRPNDAGDVRRWRLQFDERGGGPVTLADAVAYTYVTSDSRWIFVEPLDVVDVRTWRRYALSKALGIKQYAVPRAISADGRRLVISRRNCAFDCPGEPEEYYEIGFPDDPAAQVPEIATALAFTEGPTVDRDGNVYFTEIVFQRIMKLSANGVLSTFREQSNNANGLLVDPQNRLVACEGADSQRTGVLVKFKPQVTRTDLRTGEREVLADNYQGKPFVGPNDVTIDGKGRLYVTDLPGGAVYRIDGPGQVARILAAPVGNA
jgi:hypothetical protein